MTTQNQNQTNESNPDFDPSFDPDSDSDSLFQFDQLSESAKERAREWYRNGMNTEDFDFDFVLSDAADLAKIIGIDLDTYPVKLMNGKTRFKPKIHFSGFGSQGDGAYLEGTYSYSKGSRKEIRKQTNDSVLHQIADDLFHIQAQNFYRLEAKITHRGGHYYHSNSVDIDVFDREYNYRDISAESEHQIAFSLRSFMDWIYNQLWTDYEYQMSDESVDENIKCNEYTFDSEGNRK